MLAPDQLALLLRTYQAVGDRPLCLKEGPMINRDHDAIIPQPLVVFPTSNVLEICFPSVTADDLVRTIEPSVIDIAITWTIPQSAPGIR
jgi:hypothetical protein